MKPLTLLAALLLSCQAYAGQVNVEVTNPAATDRPMDIVALDWAPLQASIKGLSADNVRVVGPDNAVLLTQPVDNDGDGTIDELLFLTPLAGKETKTFSVVKDSALAIPATEMRTHARYVPERADDFAWENDVVAFRAYGPGLADGVENAGIDCFMKRVKRPVFDGWYKGEKFGKSYHIDYGEGYDGYKVGSGLGCGGTAIWDGDKLVLSNVYRQWKQFSDGPLRSSFQLSYGPWDAAGKTITEIKHITLELGKRLFKVEDSFFVDNKPARLDVAVGLSTHEGAAEVFEERDKGMLYAWEKMDGDGLGTGVLVPPSIIKEYKLIDSKKKFEGNAFYVTDTGEKGGFTYYAGYGWERAGEIKTKDEWRAYLDSFLGETEMPAKVTIK